MPNNNNNNDIYGFAGILFFFFFFNRRSHGYLNGIDQCVNCEHSFCQSSCQDYIVSFRLSELIYSPNLCQARGQVGAKLCEIDNLNFELVERLASAVAIGKA